MATIDPDTVEKPPYDFGATELDAYEQGQRPVYSVCTLVTQPAEYTEMLASFHAAGFAEGVSEFIYVDNTGPNKYDGYAAVNKFLNLARGDYIILCHQDVRLHADRIDVLDRAIADISRRDPYWGVLGNAGGIAPGIQAVRITDPHGTNTHRGDLPARVTALDENFMVVRRDANLAVSRDIGGFHLYGTDLCLIADMLGYTAYVIDFHLQHLSGGGKIRYDAKSRDFASDYPRVRKRLTEKYRRVLAARWVQNTMAPLFLSNSRILNALANRQLTRSLVKRLSRLRARLSAKSIH